VYHSSPDSWFVTLVVATPAHLSLPFFHSPRFPSQCHPGRCMALCFYRVVLPELGRTRCILLDFRLSSPLLPRLPRPTVNTCISLTQAWPGLSHVTSALPRRRVSTWQSCAFPPFSLCFGLCLKPLPFLRRLQAPCHSSSPPSFLLPLSFPVFQPLRFYSLPPFSFATRFIVSPLFCVHIPEQVCLPKIILAPLCSLLQPFEVPSVSV